MIQLNLDELASKQNPFNTEMSSPINPDYETWLEQLKETNSQVNDWTKIAHLIISNDQTFRKFVGEVKSQKDKKNEEEHNWAQQDR